MRIDLWIAGLSFLLPCRAAADTHPVKIGKFPQEVATRYGTAEGLPAADVTALRLEPDGSIVAITRDGNARFADDSWVAAPRRDDDGFVSVATRGDDRFAAGERGLFKSDAGGAFVGLLTGHAAHQVAVGPGGEVVAAMAHGLFRENDDGDFEAVKVDDGQGRLWATSKVQGVAFDAQGHLWFATPAGVGRRTPKGWRFYTGRDGLPYNDFTVCAAGANGSVWFGTRIGAVRFDGDTWAYRQGRRWLPHDHVRDIVIDRHGAAWFATANGVGRIHHRMMTLAEKAEFYEDEIEKYIRRTPFGYVASATVSRAGDRTSTITRHDTDNDGLWTSMYGAGECFAYSATRSAAAKERARRAFEALRFLQKVTQGCRHSPPRGFVARTVRSTALPDPNAGRLAHDRRMKATRDSLWKIYEPRWPKSADGAWYWKSDTSSDELDGHYFFYPLYHDLVADTAEEKERVREVVRDLTDHLIEHGFYMVDHDGTPTRWAVYGPRSLNHDKMWWPERGLKSLSILSYLTVAEHMTGDAKYGRAAQRLREEHAYGTNAMVPKIHMGIGSGNQSDDEMAFMCFYNLVKYTKDEAFRQEMLYSFYSNYALVQPEMNPFFNFAYAAFGIGARYTNPWGTRSIAPWDGWLEDSLATLTGFPLDRFSWAHRNSHRLDLVFLPRQQAVDLTDEMRAGRRGHRVNGKVLPVENRHFNHWNTDPWRLDYGGDGRQLASGPVFLLPYYMGLHHGFIVEAE